MHLFQHFVDRLTRRIPRSLDTLDEGLPDLETYFTQRDLHQAALETERAAWLVALPDDVHALLDGKQPHDLDFIRAGAAVGWCQRGAPLGHVAGHA